MSRCNHARPHLLDIFDRSKIVAGLYVIAVNQVVTQTHLVVIEECVTREGHMSVIDRGKKRHLIIRVPRRMHHRECVLFPLKLVAILKGPFNMDGLSKDASEIAAPWIIEYLDHVIETPHLRSVFAREMRESIDVVIVNMRRDCYVELGYALTGLQRIQAMLDKAHTPVGVNRVAKALEEVPARRSVVDQHGFPTFAQDRVKGRRGQGM